MLELDRVSKTYTIGTLGGTELRAVRDVSFAIDRGEVISLIGESGSGKSTIGRMLLRLLRVSGGAIRLDDVDISGLKRGDLKRYYSNVQGVFQDPFSSYNPIFKVDRVFWMLYDEYATDTNRDEWREKVAAALAAVGLDARHVLGKYPHQLSGGQLQRLLVARALLLEIDYLVADEITSMLDASTRIDVLNLLGDLRSRGLGVLFITHDLSLGNYISDRTIILRHGAIVEMGDTHMVYGNPQHPYTQMLLTSVPRLHHKWRRDRPAEETAVSREAPRSADAPPLVEVEKGHLVARNVAEGKSLAT